MHDAAVIPAMTTEVTTDETVIGEFKLWGTSGRVNLEIQNTGGDLSDFAIYLKDHEDGEFYEFLSGTDFDSTSLVSLQFATATGPHELSDGEKAHIIVDCGAAVRVQLRATSASTSQVTVLGNAVKER